MRQTWGKGAAARNNAQKQLIASFRAALPAASLSASASVLLRRFALALQAALRRIVIGPRAGAQIAPALGEPISVKRRRRSGICHRQHSRNRHRCRL